MVNYLSAKGPFYVSAVAELHSPADGVVVHTTNAVLKWWCSDDDGDNLTYKVELLGETEIYNHEYTTTSLNFTIPPLDLVVDKPYTWRIFAVDPAGNVVQSVERHFVVVL